MAGSDNLVAALAAHPVLDPQTGMPPRAARRQAVP
jgi:hypothetical protein